MENENAELETISITAYGFDFKLNGFLVDFVAFSESSNPVYELGGETNGQE